MSNEEIVDYRLDSLERAVSEIAAAVKEIAKNTGQIASLEARHAGTREELDRAFTQLTHLDSRVDLVEQEIPSLVDMRKSINRALWGLAGIVSLAMLALVIK